MSEDGNARRARYIGRSIIAGTWGLVGYLLAYYTVLLWFGPDRLYRALGGTVYNSVFPNGGIFLPLTIVLMAMVWALPVGVLSGLTAILLRLAAPTLDRRRMVIVSGLAGITFTLVVHFSSLDGWPASAFPYLWGDDTEFAPTYSPLGFWQVRVGMTPERVVALVGEPLERYAIPVSVCSTMGPLLFRSIPPRGPHRVTG